MKKPGSRKGQYSNVEKLRIKELFLAKKSVAEIARLMDRGYDGIRKFLIRENFIVPKVHNVNLASYVRMYEKGMTIREIAKKENSNYSTIHHRLESAKQTMNFEFRPRTYRNSERWKGENNVNK